MRILADENCDRLWVLGLREAGHNVTYVADDELERTMLIFFVSLSDRSAFCSVVILISAD